MKKQILFYSIVLFGFKLTAQDTIPATMVAGTLKVSSTMTAADTVKAQKDVKVAGNVEVQGNISVDNNLTVNGTSTVHDLVVGGNLSIIPISQNASLNPCIKFSVIDGYGHLVSIDPASVINLEAAMDASPCPQPPAIPFVWQTYGNHVNSNNRWIGTIENFDFNIKTNNTQRMIVKANGSVGIGTLLTNNPKNYLLAVNGTIGCKELHIEINSTTWSDFVFNKGYKLMPLKELDTYIQKNKHLPEIPSNADVDNNKGIDVAQVQSKLLQKVEELTLYILELNKKIEALEAQNAKK